MKKIIIIGAGGHGQVVADILFEIHQTGGDLKPIGYLDDDTALHGKTFFGLPVLGSPASLSDIPHDGIILAIGDNRLRQKMFDYYQDKDARFVNAIHPKAVLSGEVQLGVGIMICAGVVVNPGSEIGSNVIINTGATIDHHNQIHSHVHIAPGVNTGGEVRIEEGTLVGIGATILPRIQIGQWSTVGAGSVVCRHVSSRSTVVGIPARKKT